MCVQQIKLPRDQLLYGHSFLKGWGLEQAIQRTKRQSIESSQAAAESGPRSLFSKVLGLLRATQQACKDERELLVFSNETLDKEEAFVTQHFPSHGRIAYLNVGCQPIATHASTLQAFDDSMLGSLFGSQDWIIQERELDTDGNYCLQHDKIDCSIFQKVSKGCVYTCSCACD